MYVASPVDLLATLETVCLNCLRPIQHILTLFMSLMKSLHNWMPCEQLLNALSTNYNTIHMDIHDYLIFPFLYYHTYILMIMLPLSMIFFCCSIQNILLAFGLGWPSESE